MFKNKKIIYFAVTLVTLFLSLLFFMSWKWGFKFSFYDGVEQKNLFNENGPELSKNNENVNSEIVNNGGNYVKVGGYTYYREYKNDSFEESALHGNYNYTENALKKLVKIDENLQKEELFEDKGVGEIFVLGERLYLKEADDLLYSVDFLGQNRKNYAKGKFQFADNGTNDVIYSDLENNIVVIDNSDNEILKIPSSKFLFYEKNEKTIYFRDAISPQLQDKIEISSIKIDGSDRKFLRTLSTGQESFLDSLTVVNFQIKGEYIYVSFGWFEGTMHCYNGFIARFKKDGSDFNLLTETYLEDFLVVEKGGVDYLVFSKDSPASGVPTYHSMMNLDTKEISDTTEFLPTPVNTPFFEDTKADEGDHGEEYFAIVSMYINSRGSKINLIGEDDFNKKLGKLYSTEDKYRDIKNIECAGDYVYFSLEEGTHDEKNDVGWRWSYRRAKTEVYCKNLITSEISLINSY